MKFPDQQLFDLAHSMGLDPFPTEFHTVPAHVLYDVASRGMPGRYSHWAHGRDWFHEITKHNHGMGRIYELVINSNPSHAFLLDVNSDVINLMVQVHVLGHTDFFQHNRLFAETRRDMPELAVLRAERLRQYEEKHGVETVEKFLDAVLTLEWYGDPDAYDATIKTEPTPAPAAYDDLLQLGRVPAAIAVPSYQEQKRFAGLPTTDLLGFFMAEAPLDDWQRDVIEIVRADCLYFWPQIRTKTINEGWASFWHGKMMHALDLTDGEFTEYAKVNAGVVSAHPGALNPYWLGLKLLADIEKRFGQDKLFEVRRLETDVSLVRNYLTKELVEELKLVRYGPRGDYYEVTEDAWEKVRDGIANDFAARFPVIELVDKNFNQEGGLLLRHKHDGRGLLKTDALKVLQLLASLWGRPVYLETVVKDAVDLWSSED